MGNSQIGGIIGLVFSLLIFIFAYFMVGLPIATPFLFSLIFFSCLFIADFILFLPRKGKVAKIFIVVLYLISIFVVIFLILYKYRYHFSIP